MNIEAEAVSKVNEVLRRTGYLDPYITENDKTPVWDGFVLVVCGKINLHTIAAQKYITPQAA